MNFAKTLDDIMRERSDASAIANRLAEDVARVTQERDEARAECERLRSVAEGEKATRERTFREYADLHVECARLRADAERYRWLLKNSTYTNGVRCIHGQAVGPAYRRWYHDSSALQADTLDAAIDAARKGE